MKKEKIETNRKGDKVPDAIEAQKVREKRLVSLRIDSRTVVLVSSENATPEYASVKLEEFKKGVFQRRTWK